MKFSQIKETCFYAHDLEKTKTFYHDQLELPVIDYVVDKHIFFRAGNSVLLCFNPEDSRNKKSPPPHYGSGKLHFAFEVPREDYENARQNISKKGIKIIDSVKWKNGQESFYFEDPIGNVLEIVPQGIWD
jgi:catechol 2,3-dioxygenase-like lactoylglutathione lyase family enzyme